MQHSTSLCRVESCQKNIKAKGLCSKHYTRLERHGTLDVPDRVTRFDIRRFLGGAYFSDTDECIEWPFGKNGVGYGAFNHRGGIILAHRYICEKAHGKPSNNKLDAAHSPVICHNRACINPRHLRWATRSENMLDKAKDGITAPRRKLSDEQIISAFGDERPQHVIAAELGVDPSTISNIKTQKYWKSLTAIGEV